MEKEIRDPHWMWVGRRGTLSAIDIFIDMEPLRGAQVAIFAPRSANGAEGAVKAMQAARRERAAIPHTAHSMRKNLALHPRQLSIECIGHIYPQGRCFSGAGHHQRGCAERSSQMSGLREITF